MQLIGRQPLHCRLRSDGHEHRSFDRSMRQLQATTPRSCFGILVEDFERQETRASRYSP